MPTRFGLVAIFLLLTFIARPTIAAGESPAVRPPAATPILADPTVATYTVQDGDTLLGIAVKLGIDGDHQADWVAATVAINSLPDANSLTLGQVLYLPASTSSGTSGAAVTSLSSGAPVTQPKGGAITVQGGDTLLGIAARLGVPANQQTSWIASVVSLNGLVSADQLALGQTLTLPGSTMAVAATLDTSPPPAPPTPLSPPIASAAPVAPPSPALAAPLTSTPLVTNVLPPVVSSVLPTPLLSPFSISWSKWA